MSNIKRATTDIFAAPGVLAFRMGEVVPEGNALATKDNTASEGTKAAEAAMRERAAETEPPAPVEADVSIVNAKE